MTQSDASCLALPADLLAAEDAMLQAALRPLDPATVNAGLQASVLKVFACFRWRCGWPEH